MKDLKPIWRIAIFLLVSLLFIYLLFPNKQSLMMYVSNISPVFFSFFATVSIFLAFSSLKVYDFTKIAWLILLIGMFLNFCAESIYGYLEIVANKDMDQYFPSEADYFWCLAYPFFFGGLSMMIYGYKNSGFPIGKPKVYLMIFFGFIVVTAAISMLLLVPIIKDSDSELSSKVIYLFYPISDIIVSTLSLILIYITSQFGKSKATRPWLYLCYGFVVFSLSDLIYSYLSWNNGYNAGNIIDFGWYVGYIFVGFSGLYQKNLMDSLKKIK